MSSEKCWPFCLGLNVLKLIYFHYLFTITYHDWQHNLPFVTLHMGPIHDGEAVYVAMPLLHWSILCLLN